MWPRGGCWVVVHLMWGISSVETFLAFDYMCIVRLQGAGHLVLCTVELSVVLLS